MELAGWRLGLSAALLAAVLVGCGGGGTNLPGGDGGTGDDGGVGGGGGGDTGGGGEDPGEVLETLDLSKLSFCFDDGLGTDVITDDSGAEVGYLCVVKPSDVEADQFDTDPEFSGNGFGYHVVAFPKAITTNTQGAILISGSYGSPYNPIDSAHLGIPAGTIQYAQTLIDGINDNYIVVQPAYVNPGSINLDECGPSADLTKATNPNCHDLVRTWVLTGAQECLVNQTSCELIDGLTLGSPALDTSNSFFHRLATLMDYVGQQVPTVPEELRTLDYGQLNVMGHSQGSGHVYLIARHYAQVDRACFLAGPRDYDRINDEYADWFVPVDGTSLTPVSDMYALVSNRDADRAITMSWEHLELDPSRYTVVSDPPGSEGHQTVFTSPAHSDVRQELCF